jgi:phytoene dehydrogenase-like protein
MPRPADKEVAIIGGGHNALVCAFYLARAGHAVTIFERRHIIGGAAVTEEFHPGFRNSVASYSVAAASEGDRRDGAGATRSQDRGTLRIQLCASG